MFGGSFPHINPCPPNHISLSAQQVVVLEQPPLGSLGAALSNRVPNIQNFLVATLEKGEVNKYDLFNNQYKILLVKTFNTPY